MLNCKMPFLDLLLYFNVSQRATENSIVYENFNNMIIVRVMQLNVSYFRVSKVNDIKSKIKLFVESRKTFPASEPLNFLTSLF